MDRENYKAQKDNGAGANSADTRADASNVDARANDSSVDARKDSANVNSFDTNTNSADAGNVDTRAEANSVGVSTKANNATARANSADANKPVCNTNEKSWPEKIAPWVLVVGACVSTLGFLLAFFYASPVSGASVNGTELIGGELISNKLLISQKIFYFHMPAAIVSFAALVFACYYSIRFLMTRCSSFDTRAKVAMQIALLFVVMTMITGVLWTRFEWGVWWTWEPRLTTYLILMLIIIAYFVLRASMDEPESRATFAGVVAIIATVDVPICFMVTRLLPSSVHPVVLREGGMSGDVALTTVVCLIGFLCIGFSLYRTQLRQVRAKERVDALKDEIEELEKRKRKKVVSKTANSK